MSGINPIHARALSQIEPINSSPIQRTPLPSQSQTSQSQTLQSQIASINPPSQGICATLSQIISSILACLEKIFCFFCRREPSSQNPTTSLQQTPTPGPLTDRSQATASIAIIPTQTASLRTPLLDIHFPPNEETPRFSNAYLARVWIDTKQRLETGSYTAPSGAIRQIRADTLIAQTRTASYDTAGPLLEPPSTRIPTDFAVINRDCLDVGIALKKAGYNPLILNMANARSPGGNYRNGANSQEEDICRRSSLALAIDAELYSEVLGQGGVNHYPLPRLGGLYTPDVPVFRASRFQNYAFLEEPVKLSIATVAALYRALPESSEQMAFTELQRTRTYQKIRTQLKMALDHGHDTLVLSAFGCGAFHNPPGEIAGLYKDLLEGEFVGRFHGVYFAIIEDGNSGLTHNPRGNFAPFAETITQMRGRVIH